MTIRTNLMTTDIANYDNDTICLSVTNVVDGGYMQCTTLSDGLRIKDGQIEWWPTSNSFYRNYRTIDVVEGSFDMLYTWKTSTPNESEVEDYISYMQVNGHPNATFEYNASNTTLSYSISESNIESNTWVEGLFVEYAPYVDYIEMKAKGPGKYICVANPGEMISTWTKSRRTIAAGQSTNIDKAGNTCYIFVSDEVSSPTLTLHTDELYRLDNNSINLTNHSNTSITVLRYHI
jgi:hypothetical protein